MRRGCGERRDMVLEALEFVSQAAGHRVGRMGRSGRIGG